MFARRKRIAALGLFVMLILVGATATSTSARGVVGGSKGSEADKVVAFSTYSKVEEGLTDPAMRNDYSSRASTMASDPCKTFTFGVNGLTMAGSRAYTLEETVGWCYNGTYITYHDVSWRQSISNPFYYFGGLTSEIHQPGNNGTFYRDKITGNFVGNIVGYPLMSYSAYVDIIVRGNGTYSGSGHNGQ